MMMAVVCTEWTLICALATIWAWLYHGRYHVGFTQVRTRARRAPMPESNGFLDAKAWGMRFVAIPGGIIFALAAVKSWLDVFNGVKDTIGSPSMVLVSSLLLVGYLGMAGYEIYLLRSGRRMVRPRASRGASVTPTAPRGAARPRPPTAKRGSR